MTKAPKPKKADLVPIDWERVEAQYRAGILSVREIGRINGCSHTAIQQRATECGWSRDLKAKIQAKADELLAKQAVATTLATGNPASEKAIIDVGGAQLAAISMQQRFWMDKAVKIAGRMMAELEGTMDAPEVFAQVHDRLLAGEDPDVNQMRHLAALVAGLPERERVFRGLVESLNRAVGGQRRVYGMDQDQKSADDSDSFENLRDEAEAMLARLNP